MSKWIQSLEKLPEKNGKYLLLVQKTIVISTFYNGFFYKSRAREMFYKSWLTDDKKYNAVNYWMELPIAPESSK